MGRWTIAAYYGLTGVLTSLWGASLPAVDARLDLGAGRLGVVLLSVALGGLVAMPPAGRVAGRRPDLLRTAAPAAAAGLLGPALAPSLVALTAAAVLFGALLGVLNVSLSLAAVGVERRLARPVMSTLHGVWALGAAAGGGLTAAVLGTAFDVGALLATGATALAAGMLLLGTLGPRPAGTARVRYGRSRAPDPHPSPPAAGQAVPGPRDGADATPRTAVVTAAPTPPRDAPPPGAWQVVRLGLIGAAAFLTEGAATDWSGVHARRVLHAAPATASLVYTAFWAAMTATRFLGDLARSRFGAATTLRLAGATATVGYAVVLAAPAARGPRVAAATVGWSLVGAGMALLWPVVASTAGAVPGGASRLSWVTTLSTAGGLLGPALIGFVAATTSLPTALAIPALLSLTVTLTAPRTVASYGRPGTLRRRPPWRTFPPGRPPRRRRGEGSGGPARSGRAGWGR